MSAEKLTAVLSKYRSRNESKWKGPIRIRIRIYEVPKPICKSNSANSRSEEEKVDNIDTAAGNLLKHLVNLKILSSTSSRM